MALPTEDINTNPLAGYFWGNDPNVNQQLRQRIALQLMAGSGKKGFPKNLGEGLSAIGDSLGELGMARRLEQADLAQQKAAAAGVGAPAAPAPAAARTAYAPPRDTMSDTPEPGSGPIATAAPAPDLASVSGVSPSPVSEGGFNPIDAQAPEADTQGVSGGGYNPVDAAMDPWIGRSRAIAGIESGGAKDPYATMGAPTRTGDRAYGKYQVMGANIPSWTQAALGTSMTPQQFLADKAAQEATFKNQFGGYADKYGEEGAARAWYGGPGANPNATDLHGRLTVAGYGQDYMKRLLGNQQTSPRDAVAQAMMMRPTAQAVPQPNPTSTGGPTMPPTSPAGQTPIPSTPVLAGGPAQATPPDQRLAFNGLPPEINSGVSAAPPMPSALRQVPQQVAQVTPQQAYPPGYVPPPAADPMPPPTVKMDPEEVRLRTLIANNPGNQYYATQAAPMLQALTQDREKRQAYADKIFEAKISQQTEATKLRIQAEIDQAKRIADIAQTQAQTRKENILENPEEKYIMGPDNVVRPVKVEGEDPNAMPGGKLSETEQKTLIYHNWAQQGNQAITGNDKLLANGLQQELLGKVPFVGNKEQNDAYRRAKNGADNFILAFMRSTSGAAYGAQERLDHARAMLPRYGDDAKTLADKAAQRQGFVDTEYAGLGRQGQKKADYIAKTYDTSSAETRQRQIDIEMQGVKGGMPGEVKTNRKTGQQRMWNGSRWVETQ